MANILIVDDSATLRESLAFVLTDAGHIVTKAENGMDGLNKYKENSDTFQLVITDINMPVLSGLDLISIIKEESMSVQFIILSGYNDFDLVHQALKFKINDYLLKPVNKTELISLVNDVNQSCLRHVT